MHPALESIRNALRGTPFEGQVRLVGGAVRDELLGIAHSNDFDLVTELDALALAETLWKKGVSDIPPVTYPRFRTALVRTEGANVELVTARKESYAEESRKPDIAPATLREDAQRRDFTVNALMRNIHSGELLDLLGMGLSDLESRTLRTPLDPAETFRDDPLRMLRAVRFVWQLRFVPAPGLYDAIREERDRLSIISEERIRDEFVKMMGLPDADRALSDLESLGLLALFAPELLEMKGVTQGRYHHLDVWDHTLLAVRNTASDDPLTLLAVLLHDVGKPATRSVDERGDIRFFQHERVGEKLAFEFMSRLRFSREDSLAVAKLVRNHMRLQTMAELTPSAARRLVRDLGPDLGRLLDVVEADASALRPGVKAMDVPAIRRQIEEVARMTPAQSLESPLSGEEIMDELGLEPGPDVGRRKTWLIEQVLEGRLTPDDKAAARVLLKEFPLDFRPQASD
ncbi:MAG TPA: HD domain-containing protein [Fimbriimonadaceae bacterium]|nr:HD domain-containing protein [Fimbriimonadaceae bacterium]